MIYLEKNTTNIFILELNSIKNTPTPFYLFEFIHLQTNSTVFFKTNNLSGTVCRYDKFEIVDNDLGTDMLNDGIIYQENETFNMNNGQYKYNIYINNIDYNINDLLIVEAIIESGIVSTGKMIVNGIDATIDSIYL
jgi:hypothetical protein